MRLIIVVGARPNFIRALPERWDDQVSARVVNALASGVEPLAGW